MMEITKLALLATLILGVSSKHIDEDGDALMSYLRGSSYARGKVIDLIVDEYTARPENEESSIWLEDAMYAMELSESDAEPAGIEGHDFIFVGSVGASMNEDAIRKHGITHVIDWSNSARCNRFDGIEYLCLTGIRGHEGMLSHLADLDKAVDFVEDARKAGGKVLSHCWYGKNRSVTGLIAYLMKYEGMGPREANELIKLTRPQAKPYWDSLEAYSKRLDKLS